jgi:Zn-dependent protease
MLGEFVAGLLPYAIVAWLVLLIVLLWPLRRRHRISTNRVIPASMEWIWNIHKTNLDDPHSAALFDMVVEVTQIPGDPKVTEYVYDFSGGHRTNLVTIREQTLEERKPDTRTIRTSEIDGKPFPFGPESEETLRLAVHPDGTLTTIDWHGETATLWEFLAIWRTLRQFLRKLEKISRSDPASVQPGHRRRLWVSLGVSAVALGSFALWLGWLGAVLLAGGLILHEFGHWIAMRLTGQPAPRVMLIPFLGGVAVANHPHKTLFDDAFCSLMGAGFSLIPCLGFLLVGYAVSPFEMAFGWINYLEDETSVQFVISYTGVALSILLAFLNLFQLLPIMPLDGGQILRALLQSFSVKWARRALIVITGCGILFFLNEGNFILAAVFGLGALLTWHSAAVPLRSRPMGAAGITAIAAGYLLTIAIYVAVIIYGAWLFGFDFLARAAA